MAVFFPPDAKAKDAPRGPEQQVLDALRRLDDTWTIIPNLNIAKHPKHLQGEADIVIIHDGVILLLEIKGGQISRDSRGAWSQNGKKLKCPATQAKDNFYALSDYCKRQLGRSIMGSWCCVFPQSKTRIESIEWNAGQFLDARAMAVGLEHSVAGFLDHILQTQLPKFCGVNGRITREESKELIKILKPEIDGDVTTADQVEFAEIEIARLEEGQRDMLGVVVENPRVLLQGGAGSGKTVLGYMACVERLRGDPACRVAFVCCSEHLANDVRKRAEASGFSGRFEVLSLPDIAKYCWSRIIERKTSFYIGGMLGFLSPSYVECWVMSGRPEGRSDAEVLSSLSFMQSEGRAEVMKVALGDLFCDAHLVNHAIQMPDARFDFVAVDEAQDFVYNHIELCFLNLIIKGGLIHGNVLWIQDMYQSIRPSFVRSMTSDSPVFSAESAAYTLYTLPSKNYRNPAGVTEFANSFLGQEAKARALRAKTLVAEVEFIESDAGLREVLLAVIEKEVEVGIDLKDIAIITVDGFSEPVFRQGVGLGSAIAVMVPADEEDRVMRDRSDIVRVMTLLESKGREFPVVILVDLPDMDLDFELRFMHVAATRAKAKLYVLSHSARMKTLRRILGEASGQ